MLNINQQAHRLAVSLRGIAIHGAYELRVMLVNPLGVPIAVPASPADRALAA